MPSFPSLEHGERRDQPERACSHRTGRARADRARAPARGGHRRGEVRGPPARRRRGHRGWGADDHPRRRERDGAAGACPVSRSPGTAPTAASVSSSGSRCTAPAALPMRSLGDSSTLRSVGRGRRSPPYAIYPVSHPDPRGVFVAVSSKDRWVFGVTRNPGELDPAAFGEEAMARLIVDASGVPRGSSPGSSAWGRSPTTPGWPNAFAKDRSCSPATQRTGSPRAAQPG